MNKNISVLISIYQKEKASYFKDALESIINQTYKPNEIVLVKDGDLTEELNTMIDDYVKRFPKLFNIIELDKNYGLGIALKEGIPSCHNNIVFRMDSDDISEKKRFEKTIEIFEKKNVDVVGTNIAEYDEKMEKELRTKNRARKR